MAAEDDKQDKPRDDASIKRRQPQPREKLHREDFDRVQRVDDEEAFDGEPPPASPGASNTGQAALAETMRGLRNPGEAQGAAGGAGTAGAPTPEQQAAGISAVPAPPEPRTWTFGGGGDDPPPKFSSTVVVETEEHALPVPRGTWSALAAAPPDPPDQK